MKAVKIILAIAVVAVIGLFVWKWLAPLTERSSYKPPINQFTERIESEIDSLSKSPVNVFCKNFYKEIQYRINDYHEQGFFGKSESDNDQWKEILSKNLYSAYASKFAEQAMYVFNGSEWRIDNLNFIRNEVKELKKSEYLDLTANYFNQIDQILAKYDEIAGFVSHCNNFTFDNYELGVFFPNVSDKIQKSRAYLSNNNGYVDNCTRLKNGLQEIPQKLFNKHTNYLHTKIQQNGNRYNEFNYQSDYSNTIYTPLKNQIEDLNNDVYGIGNNAFDNGYNSLENLLSSYNRDATNYFRNKN